jgi:hypothetical protein
VGLVASCSEAVAAFRAARQSSQGTVSNRRESLTQYREEEIWQPNLTLISPHGTQ